MIKDKTHFRHFIQFWSEYFFLSVVPDFTETQIVRQYKNDIWPVLRICRNTYK